MSYKPLSLEGRVAVVIGGTTGIGRAISLGFAEAGADVVASARRIEQVESVAAEIEQRGRRSIRATCDVLDLRSLENLRDKVISSFSRADILVNCAGRTKRISTLQMEEKDWNDILQTNLTGTLRGCRVFAPHMLERRYGRIINIGSLTSFVALYEVTAYATSKAGVTMLTKQLATEWGPHGVCVNAIAPGLFRTDLNKHLLDGTERGREFIMRTPLRRFGKVEELAGAAIFLASDAASFVNGEIIVVDGGILASGVNQ